MVKIQEKKYNINSMARGIYYILPIVYKIMFEIVYCLRISQIYSGFGTYLNMNYIKGIASWIIFLIIFFFWKCLHDNKLKSVLGILLYLSIIPSLSVFWLKNENMNAFILISIYWLMWLLATWMINRAGKGENCESKGCFVPQISNVVILIIFVWLILSTLFFSYKYGNFRIFVRISDVYTYRNNNNMPTIFSYLFNWNLNVLLPLLFIICIKNRKVILSIVCVVLFLMSYSIFGNKSMLFSIFMIIGIGILDRLRLSQVTDEMLGVALLIYQVLILICPKPALVSILHRLLLVPAELHYYYYDFFTQPGNEFLYLRESILRWFTDSPYKDIVSVLIGSNNKYYPTFKIGDYNNVNNGLFSDAFMNFGVMGVLVYPIIIVLVLYFVLKIMNYYDDSIQYTFLVMTLMYVMSGYLFSWLLTGGVIVFFVVIFMIRRTKSINDFRLKK